MPIFIFWWWKLNSGLHRSPWFTRDSLGAPRGLNVFQHYTGHSLIWTFCFMHMLFFHDHMLFLFLLSVIKIFYPSFFTWLIPIYPLWLCWNSIIGFQTKFSECLLFANDTRQIRMQNSGKAHIAAAKSLQSCPTPLDGSPPSSSIPGILQARTLEWVAISFSKAHIETSTNKWKLIVTTTLGFPGGSDGKASAYNVRDSGFDRWVGKILWRRKWQPIPVLLPGKSHRWRSLVGYSLWGCKESDMSERLHFFTSLWKRASLVAQMVKNLPAMQDTQVQSLCWKDLLEEDMAIAPVFLLREFHEQRSLVGYSPWGHKKSDTTEQLHFERHV